jgi:hypothetical protein
MKPYETFTHAGYRISIHQDTDAQAPENDDEVFIVTTRNRHFQVDQPGFELDDIRDGKHNRKYHVFPLYAYIHSGVALSLGNAGQFSDPWDAGQIGYVLAAKSSFRVKPRTRKCKVIASSAEDVGRGTVESWNQYLSGDVWGYVIEDSDGDHVDSCWGFYGLKHARDEASYAAVVARKHEETEAAKVAQMMHV